METPRYFYHPDLSIWLSIDPLSDKYPNLTPYAFCANNPVVLVDPDGRKDRPFNAKTDKPIAPQKGTETPIYSFDKNGKAVGLASGWTSAYNCHSYAWHNSKGDTDPADGDIPKIGGVPIPKWGKMKYRKITQMLLIIIIKIKKEILQVGLILG